LYANILGLAADKWVTQNININDIFEAPITSIFPTHLTWRAPV